MPQTINYCGDNTLQKALELVKDADAELKEYIDDKFFHIPITTTPSTTLTW